MLECPGYGNPCNGCGSCCRDQPCPQADLHRLWKNDRCAALERKGGSYRCGLMVNPGKYVKGIPRSQNDMAAHRFRKLLGAGAYCDKRDIKLP